MLSITLVDALLKRVKFLNSVIKELNLENIEAIHARCEDYEKDHREEFDVVTCRAVANLSSLLKYCMPLVKENGWFIPMKAKCEEEIKKAIPLLKKEHCFIEKIDHFYLPIENSERTIIKIKKIKK